MILPCTIKKAQKTHTHTHTNNTHPIHSNPLYTKHVLTLPRSSRPPPRPCTSPGQPGSLETDRRCRDRRPRPLLPRFRSSPLQALPGLPSAALGLFRRQANGKKWVTTHRLCSEINCPTPVPSSTSQSSGCTSQGDKVKVWQMLR